MLFPLHGRRTARIKKHTETQDHCKNCKSFDLDIKVYRDYYHFIWIPFVPVGDKTARIYCNQCGEGLRTETIRKHYEKITRTPFWLYSGVILIVLLVAFVVIANLLTQIQKAKYAENPQIGDVYLMRKDESKYANYYFMKINRVTADSIYLYNNNLEYLFYPSEFGNSDFFRKEDQVAFARKDLKQMLDNGSINNIKRGYSEKDGFERMQ